MTGKVPPSQLARALKRDGRQVIVKGTGTMDSDNNGTEVRLLCQAIQVCRADIAVSQAAVCIFESYTPAKAMASGAQQDVHGIARMVWKSLAYDPDFANQPFSAGASWKNYPSRPHNQTR